MIPKYGTRKWRLIKNQIFAIKILLNAKMENQTLSYIIETLITN